MNIYKFSLLLIFFTQALRASPCPKTKESWNFEKEGVGLLSKNHIRKFVITATHLVWCNKDSPSVIKGSYPLYNLNKITIKNHKVLIELLVEQRKRKTLKLSLCKKCSKERSAKDFIEQLKPKDFTEQPKSKESSPARKKQSKIKVAKSHRILFFGDQGTGKFDALRVAEHMAKFCTEHNCNYGLSAGDNIYHEGVSIFKKGWELEYYHKFTKIYRTLWQKTKMPIYLTLGNHDVGVTSPLHVKRDQKESIARNANYFKEKRIPFMKSQVAFTNHKSNQRNFKNERQWNLYGYHYSYLIEKEGIKTFLVSLNTNTFPGSLLLSKDGTPNNFLQLEWLEQQLKSEKAKTADWRIVLAHHPLYSVGRHGVNNYLSWFGGSSDTEEIKRLRNILQPIFCQNKVEFYLVGHDHHLQLDAISCPMGRGGREGSSLVQVLSGSAAKATIGNFYEKILNKVPAFSRKLFLKSKTSEYVLWANGLRKEDFLKEFKETTNAVSKRVKKTFGFSFLELKKKSATLKMIQSLDDISYKGIGCWKMKKENRLTKPEFVAQSC